MLACPYMPEWSGTHKADFTHTHALKPLVCCLTALSSFCYHRNRIIMFVT
jgi:hypothetical protein